MNHQRNWVDKAAEANNTKTVISIWLVVYTNGDKYCM